jgi:two-component sensor histidine kinase
LNQKPAAAPRRWFGRNLGLRPLLVLIVGFAMLLPGALAVLQAVHGYRSSMRTFELYLTQAAQVSANEEENVISASREILTSLAAHPDVRPGGSPRCRQALQRAISGLDQYSGAAIVNAEGRLTCASAALRSTPSVQDRTWFREVMAGDGFVVGDLEASEWLGAWGIVNAVPLIDAEGAIQGSVALFIGLDWLTRRYQRATSSNTALALLDKKGEILAADSQHSPESLGLPSQQLIDRHMQSGPETVQTRTFVARGHDGAWRMYAISPLLGGRIFVILGMPLFAAVGSLTLQMVSGVFAPILMWILAVVAVWFCMETFVVRWITYLERITSVYASGRQNVRPERVAVAPVEIRRLGETFARMADLISAREAELRESLHQKEILVREIHHRVKNNLQLVMSLLNLHARRIRDPQAELAFAEARSRINALATLHRRLYESESLQEVDLKWFLDDLCAELRRSGLSRNRHVELTIECRSEVIGPAIAVPLGLLVTEAITNAYKHAFEGRLEGKIAVRVVRDSDKTLTLSITDDGVGFDPATVGGDGLGLGRSLIEAFARQLHGELQVKSDRGGTEVQVRFAVERRAEERSAEHPVSSAPTRTS